MMDAEADRCPGDHRRTVGPRHPHRTGPPAGLGRPDRPRRRARPPVDDTGSRRGRPSTRRSVRPGPACPTTTTVISPWSTGAHWSGWCPSVTCCPWPRSVRPTRPARMCRPASRAWWWPRPPSGTCGASRASSTTGSTRPPSWPPGGRSRTSGSSSSTGRSPTARSRRASAPRWRPAARLPPGVTALLPALAGAGSPLDVLRSGVSLLGAELGWRPTLDIGADDAPLPGVGPLCAASRPCWPRPTACAGVSGPSHPVTTCPRWPTTCGC